MAKQIENYRPLSQVNLMKGVFVTIGLVVDGVLDPVVLQSTLSAFITRWPLLGGKIQAKHTPVRLTASGNYIDFKSRNIAVSLASALPYSISISTSDQPHYQSINFAENLFHFDKIDISVPEYGLLALRATVLNDATLLGWQISHYIVNAADAFRVIAAFCELLAGRPIVDDLVLPPDAVTPMSELLLSSVATSMSTAANDQEKGQNDAENVMFKGFYGLEQRKSWRLIHLPAAFITALHSECQTVIDTEAKPDTNLKLSRNDVITAWFIKKSFAPVHEDDGPASLYYPFTYRRMLPPCAPGTTYVSNSKLVLQHIWLSLHTLQAQQIAHIAADVRRLVLKHRDPAVVAKGLKQKIERYNGVLEMPIDGSTHLDRPAVVVTNWTLGRFDELVFDGAAKDGGGAKVLFVEPLWTPFMGAEAAVLSDGAGGVWIRVWNVELECTD